MSVDDARTRIKASREHLLDTWCRTAEQWRDNKRNQFEKTYINPLDADTRKAEQALERIAFLIIQARRECK